MHHLVISDAQSLNTAISLTVDSGFIFIKSSNYSSYNLPDGINIISEYLYNKEKYALLKKVMLTRLG